MLTTIFRMKFKDGKEEEALKMVTTLAEGVAADEPDTLAYVVHRNLEDPSEFVFFEVYADKAALETHGKSPHMAAMRENFADIFDTTSIKLEKLDRIGGAIKAS